MASWVVSQELSKTEKLNGANFSTWKHRIRRILFHDKVEYVIDIDDVPTPPPENSSAANRRMYEKFLEDDKTAKFLLADTDVGAWWVNSTSSRHVAKNKESFVEFKEVKAIPRLDEKDFEVRFRSEKSVLGNMVDTIAGPHPSSISTGTSVIQAPSDELSDFEDEPLEVLESVVSSKQESETLANLKPATSLDVGSCDSHTSHGMISPQPPKVNGVKVQSELKLPDPLDLLGSRVKGRVAEIVSNKSLSKFAQKRLRKLAKEQSSCSLSNGGT
ncbi:hypothetical protein RHSIM_Rhsim07G0156700 [Rhododendron simsii]|uniref:Uncharacterized protein n=1 Tax=Rhododendron simsii TaxID=118357 RepID=A0A834GPR4_RHOSS|nr:hypothetical protein RHSIM_Rhsim07G0156700 [Rhododendron simsii]